MKTIISQITGKQIVGLLAVILTVVLSTSAQANNFLKEILDLSLKHTPDRFEPWIFGGFVFLICFVLLFAVVSLGLRLGQNISNFRTVLAENADKRVKLQYGSDLDELIKREFEREGVKRGGPSSGWTDTGDAVNRFQLAKGIVKSIKRNLDLSDRSFSIIDSDKPGTDFQDKRIDDIFGEFIEKLNNGRCDIFKDEE